MAQQLTAIALESIIIDAGGKFCDGGRKREICVDGEGLLGAVVIEKRKKEGKRNES